MRQPGDEQALAADSYSERVRERFSNMQRADVSWAARPGFFFFSRVFCPFLNSFSYPFFHREKKGAKG